MIKFIYFDVGGVFVNCENYFKKATSDFKIPYDAFLKQWDIYNNRITRGEITPQEFWNKARANLQIADGVTYDFLENWISDYIFISPTSDFIKEISSTFRVGLLTNIYKGMLSRLMQKDLVPSVEYSVIIDSSEVHMKKPDKEIYELAQQKANILSAEILLVDDREDFIKAASKFGWKTLHFQTNNPLASIKDIKQMITTPQI